MLDFLVFLSQLNSAVVTSLCMQHTESESGIISSVPGPPVVSISVLVVYIGCDSPLSLLLMVKWWNGTPDLHKIVKSLANE